LSNQYLEVEFQFEKVDPNVIIAFLQSLPFDSFWEEKDTIIKAYIKEDAFVEKNLDKVIKRIPFTISYTIKQLEDQNWNELWESNFDSITVDDFCYVRADFHPNESNCTHTITINPKQSFGTGHHETTFMMIQEMSTMALKGKRIVDLGTGTGILAILAANMDAATIIGTEIDPGALQNADENVTLNGTPNVKLTDHRHTFDTDSIDVTIANIHKNTLVEMADDIMNMTVVGGHILLSGILNSQADDVQSEFEQMGAELVNKRTKGDWVMLHLKRS